MKRTGERFLKEDEIVSLPFDETTHMVSENHFYKSEGYYALVKNEASGVKTLPRSSDVIDAYVVPICLEKAMLEGIDVCDWEISYSYAKAPCIIYGLNYFSTPDEFVVATTRSRSAGCQARHEQRQLPVLLPDAGDGEKRRRRRRSSANREAEGREAGGPGEKVYDVFSILW